MEEVSATKEALSHIVLFLVSVFPVISFTIAICTHRGSLSLINNIPAFNLGAILSFGRTNEVVHGALVSIKWGSNWGLIDECTAVFSPIVYRSAVLAYQLR